MIPLIKLIELFPQVYVACGFPFELHITSVEILAMYLDEQIAADYFGWQFHLPNSDYLELSLCILENF